tara:strand:+ start:130 stop:513 length:384 start_codon:yes stop_codon:yes gene_type:complete
VDLRKAKVAKEDSEWVKYFARIRNVCPWSYRLMDSILVWENDETCLSTIACLFPKTKFEAFVFVYKNKTAKQLEQLADKMNSKYTHSEFLWSHPNEGGDSTHVPCLIQQDRDKLTQLRENLGYVDEN